MTKQTPPTKMTSETNYKNKAVKCMHCKSNNYSKQGYRRTENRGKIQKYLCKDCNRYFTNDEGFYRMRNSEQKVTMCIDLYYKGVSLRNVQRFLKAHFPHNSTPMSIYRWIVKYSNLVSKFTDNLSIEVGKEMMSDEMEYYRRINRYSKGREQNWFVDTFDLMNRFMITGEYMKSRTNDNLESVMRVAKSKTGEQVKIVTTDGLLGYPSVLRATFGLQSPYHATSRTKSKIIHNVVIASERGFNHPIERLHNTIRERTKIMRGFHGALKSAKAIMKGFEINYNFVRGNLALNGKTPSDVATNIEFKSSNRWLELIEIASKQTI